MTTFAISRPALLMPALWMPVEMTRSSLDYQTPWMSQDCVDYFHQSMTKG